MEGGYILPLDAMVAVDRLCIVGSRAVGYDRSKCLSDDLPSPLDLLQALATSIG